MGREGRRPGGRAGGGAGAMVAQLRDAVPEDVQPLLYVNGKLHRLPRDRAEQTLLAYLRGAPGPAGVAPLEGG